MQSDPFAHKLGRNDVAFNELFNDALDPLWISTSNWLRDPQLASCRCPKHSPQIGRSQLQKRKRNPTVGAMLLRWRKPLANPPFTCVNMMPE